jgi:hypothetical protein
MANLPIVSWAIISMAFEDGHEKMTDRKKQCELRVLAAARGASIFFPDGEIIVAEVPDFQIKNEAGTVGIELTELLSLPRNDSFNSPLAEESLHEDVVRLAEEDYYRTPGATPVKVTVYFWDVERRKNRKHGMAHALSAFVASHREQACPVATFVRRDKLPYGFGTISIAAVAEPWFSGECIGNTVAGIHQQLTARIAAKNSLVSSYRANLADSPIWLLLYSGAGISQGIPMVQGIGEWSFTFDFDRVFFFAALDGKVEEIKRRV